MDTLKIALVIGVEYDTNGTSRERLRNNLSFGAEHLYAGGKFTQDTKAEVETWDEKVIEDIDAAEIVKRCNAYPELVKATGALLQNLRGMNIHPSHYAYMEKLLQSLNP